MTLHWIIPGLFGLAGNHATRGVAAPRFPLLERLLTRADRSTGPVDFAGALFDVFGVPNESASIATAPLCYLADTGHLPDTWVAHADPVHLRADQDRLLLFAGPNLTVDDGDARSLTARLNAHFEEDGLRFEAPSSDRWYVHADGTPSIKFSSLEIVSGRNIDSFLPQGTDQRNWRRYLNESQMLFHDLDLNQAREARGSLAISGVWFSGGGFVPKQIRPRIQAASGASPLLKGLCALTKIPRQDLTVLPADRLAGDRLELELEIQWAVINADDSAWRAAVERIEARLNASSPNFHVRIYPCNGQVFDYEPHMRIRVWRKARPLPAWLDQTL